MRRSTLCTIAIVAATVAACTAAKAAGLADPATGEPTETGQALAAAVHAVTGIGPMAAIGLWKAGEALLTKRGRTNAVNVVSPSTGFWSSVRSFLAIALGTDSPPEVKAKLAS